MLHKTFLIKELLQLKEKKIVSASVSDFVFRRDDSDLFKSFPKLKFPTFSEISVFAGTNKKFRDRDRDGGEEDRGGLVLHRLLCKCSLIVYYVNLSIYQLKINIKTIV